MVPNLIGTGSCRPVRATAGVRRRPVLSRSVQFLAGKLCGGTLLSCLLYLLVGPVPAVWGGDAATAASDQGFQPLFDGKSFAGWEGDQSVFRIADNAVVGGNLQAPIPHNYFLATTREYADFELRLEFRLVGQETNAGVQLRSVRIPNHHEMIGYQADLGQSYWGCLYDESRRNRVLARPDAAKLAQVLRSNDWNTYRIRCEGRRIQLWINDFQTVDYTEDDEQIVQRGRIALQIHGGPPGEAWYRGLQIRELSR